MGERYKLCPGEVKDYVRGYYGKPPVPIKEEISKKIIGDEQIIQIRPADLLEPGLERARQEVAHWSDEEEDVLTYALFPQVATKFFEYREGRIHEDIPQISSRDELGEELQDEQQPVVKLPSAKVIEMQSRGDSEMNIDEIRELILMLDQTSIAELELQKDDCKLSLRKTVSTGQDKIENNNTNPVSGEENISITGQNITEVVAPMVGTFYAAPAPDASAFVKLGDRVASGQTLCILEAMKLMNEIKSECAGTIVDILVGNAEPVEYGQTLFLIEKDD